MPTNKGRTGRGSSVYVLLLSLSLPSAPVESVECDEELASTAAVEAASPTSSLADHGSGSSTAAVAALSLVLLLLVVAGALLLASSCNGSLAIRLTS
jgi:hypothetical protein